MNQKLLELLYSQGFDKSQIVHTPEIDSVEPKCSKCHVTVVRGTNYYQARHEKDCPNQVKEEDHIPDRWE